MATYDPFASVQDPTSLGLLGPFVDSPPTKTDEVLAATQEKVDMLKQLAAEHRQRLAEAKGTTVDVFGLELDSVPANVANLAASIGSSAMRVGGNALSMPFSLGTASYTNKLQPKDYEVFNKINTGKATPEEVAYFNAKQYDSDYGKMSPKDVFAQVQDLENIVSSIGDSQDYSMYVEQGARKVFDQELADGGRAGLASLRNSVEGMSSDTAPLAYKISNAISASASIGNLLANAVKVSAGNPVAAMEYMGEQIPMLGLGSAGLIGKIVLAETTLGYAGEYYNKGMQAYKAKNGGEYPPEKQRAEMLRDAVSLAAAEYVGTMMSVSAMGLNKAVTPLALMGKAAGTTAVKEAGELGLKSMLKGAGVGTLDAGKNVLKAAFGEAGTEGYQTYAEGQLLGKPASDLEIYKGATIGGLASGGITAPFATVAALTGNTEANIAKRKAKIAERKAVNDAILSGNADAFLDPASKTYDLNKGMEILHGIVTNKDAAPDVRMEASNKAQAIYDDMQSRIAAAEELLNSKGLTPDVLKKIEGVPDYLNKAESDAEAILADRMAKGKDTTNIQGLLDKLNGFRTAMDDTNVQDAISTLTELPEKIASIADTVTSINESNVKDSYEAYIAELQGTQVTADTTDELVVKKGSSQDVVDLNVKARKEAEDRLQEVTTQISELEKTIASTTDADAKAVLEDGLQQAHADQTEAQNNLDWYSDADQQVTPSVTVKPGEARYDDFKAVTEAYAKAEEENHAAWKAQDGTPEKEAAYNIASDALTVAWEKRNTLTELILAEKAKGKTTVSPEKISLIRSMGDLGSMTPEEALAIADDTSVDLTEKERSYLRKFSAARIAYNAMQDVASVTRTVINGDKANKNKSITDYHNGIAQAIRENNFTHAMALQRGIEKWAANQLQRAKLGREALNARLDGSVKKQINIIRKTDNTWESTTEEWSDADLRINGGFSVSKGSGKLIAAIEIEADALQAASLETADMIAVGFDVATPVAATTDASISPNEAQQAPVEAEATQAPVLTETPVEQAPAAPVEVSPIPVRIDMPTPTKADTVEAVNDLEDDVVQEDTQEIRTEPTIEVTEDPVIEDVTPTPKAPSKAERVKELKGEERTLALESLYREEEHYSGSGVLYSLSRGVSFLSGKFTQNKGNGATTKPLASVSNFFSAWRDFPSIIDEFIKEKDRTPEQNYALGVLLRKVTEWMPMIDGLLVKQDAKFESQYLYESFMIPVRENGKIVSYELEENVKAAIAYAVFSFIQNAGGMTYKRTLKEINALLQRQKNFPVSPAEYKKFSLIGERRGAVINDLGQRVVESLGIKANKDTPVVMDSRLQNQLGDIALRLMFEIGAVTGHTKTMSFESAKASGENFIRFANVMVDTLKEKSKKETIDYEVQRKAIAVDTENRMIAVSGQGSKSIVSKMMGVEEKVKEPSLQPVETTSADLGSKFQDSPSELLNTLNESNKIENFAYEEGFVVLDGMDSEYALEMMGKVIVDGNNKRTQKTKVLAIQAVNEGIERNWFGMKEFINKTLKNDFSIPFFLKHVPWSQNRAGIEQTIFNPQADKAGARFLMTRKEWQTTIDRNNIEEVNALLIAVALAMDIDIDKKSHEAALNDVTKALGLTVKEGVYSITNPVFSAAVEAIYDRIYSDADLTDAEQRSIVNAVAKTKTGLHGLQGLIALANMLHAQRTDIDSFTVHLIAEADGVTNGPMLTNLLWGTYGTPAFLERGGFFGLNPQEQHKDYNVWRGVEGRNDLYEDNAKGMVEHLTRRMKAAGDVFKQQLNHVYYFTKPLIKEDGTATPAARKIVKTPTTQFHFGSGMETLVTGMFNEFLSGMYDKMEDVANAEAGERAQAMQTLATHINGLLPQGLKIDTTTKAYEEDKTKFWVEFEFSDKQLNAMASVFQDTLGDAIEATFNDKFQKVIKVKDAITTGSNLAFNIYNATYQYLRDMIGDSITFEQEEAIRERIKDMLPTVATQFSKESDNGADARIPMMGKRNRRESRRPGYRSVLRFKPFQLEDGTSLSTMTTYGYENLDDSPRVSMVAMPIHSLDSRTSHGAVKGTEALNIHDADLTGVGRIVDQALRLNTNLWNALLEYSPVREVANGLMRTIQAIPVVVASMTKEEADAYISMLAAQIKQPDPSRKANSKDAYAQIVESMAALYGYAAQADTQKLGFMANMAYLSQYAYEGGALEVTDAMRQAASAKLMTVDKAFTPEQQQAILATKPLLQTKKDESTTYPVLDSLPNYVQGQKTMRYAGIGSRKTPANVLAVMSDVAKYLQGLGYTLYSGGAKGADTAFSNGVTDRTAKTIFTASDVQLDEKAKTIAREVHPNPSALSDVAVNLMARNTYQIMGADLDSPVDFVLAWTPNGETKASDRVYHGKDDPKNTGGTGQAIAIASIKGIPVINMANPNWKAQLKEVIDVKTQTTVVQPTTKKQEAKTSVTKPDTAVGLTPHLSIILKAAKVAYYAFGKAERAGAIKALKTLLNPVTDETILAVIEAIIASERGDETALAGIDVTAQIATFERIVSELQTVKADTAVWGELTNAPAKFPGLVAALSQPNVTKDSLVQALKAITSEAKIPYFDMLLNSIMKIIPDFKVVYLTEDVKRSDVPEKVMTGNEFAQFVLDEGKATLYVRGHMYANSSVTPETILHELIHSVLSAMLVSNSQTDVQKAAIAEITKMYELAKVTLEAKYSRVFGSPDLIRNLDEFITYGITNEEFMTDLQGIAYTTEGLFKAFVRTVFKALGLTQDKLQTVFGALINNVSGLIAEQETNTTKAVSDTIIRSHSPAATVRKYTTVEIFDGLSKGTLQASFEAHLKGILNGIVNTLHGPFGTLAKAVADSSALSPLDVYTKAVNDKAFPFVSDIIASGFVVSEQEQFVAEQIEATVRAAIEDNEGHTTIAYTQLTRMFNEAYKKYPNAQAMLPNWNTATKTEQQRAEALHAFLFKVENGADGKSNHIARFAAMVLGVEEVNALFQYGSQNREATPVPTTFTERLLSWFNKVLNAFESRATKTYSGQKADVKMESLLKTLVGIEMKKRYRLMQPDKLGDRIEEGTEYLTNKGKQVLYKFGNSRVFTKSKNAFVGALGTAITVTAQDQVEAMLEATRKVYSKAGQHQYGLAMGVLNEMRGAVEATLPLHKLLRISKRLENRRKDIMTTVGNTILSSFGKRSFSKKESEAMTKYLIRSGAFMLLDTMSLEEIEKLFSDEAYLKTEVTKIEQALDGLKVKGIPGLANFYITTAKALGHSLMTEEDKTQHVLGNAIQIATLAGTEKSGKVPSTVTAQAIPLIDKLATLQAILSGNVADQQREMVANIMREQLSRGDKGNGVHMTLLAHKHYIEEATKKMFKGKTYLVPKGFVPEVLNPHVEVMVAGTQEDKRLRQLGYSKAAPVELDRHDNFGDARIYTIKGSGMRPWLSGVFSYSGLSTRYVGKLMKRINPNTVSGQIEQVAIDNKVMLREPYVNQLLSTAYTGFDPTVGTQLWARPTINDQMKIIDYKQVLPGHIKDSVQERNNNFSQLLGTLASNVFDSDSSLELNEKVVRELYDFYHANKAGDARSYVRVSPLSSDPEIREIALKLPKETREAILKVWGPQGMLVRYDTLDLLFGYRKNSATDAVFRSADEGKYYAKVITDVFSIMFARTSHEGDRTIARERAQRWLNNVGDVWEEIVSETKDIIVMKTGIVLLNNITSNYFELFSYGLSPFDIWKYFKTAIIGARAYHRDAGKLAYLKHQLEVGYSGNEAETRRQIALLENDIVRNPVSKLIEEGLMPTIVEDVASDEDSYSYKSGLTAKVNKHLDKHKNVQKVAKFLYMSRDGWMYQTLSSVTQHSDFVARYALYQHMTNKARNPMTHDAAIQAASDAFINYDIPSHRKLQWANDMGLVMFTKYLIRIQKVILHLARNHPLSSLTTLLLNQYLDALPMIYDSGVFGDSYGGGLLHAGALEYPGVVDNIATLRMLGL